MGAYGYIRGTGELDIFINSTEGNVERAIAACIAYGIPKATLTKEMFIIPKMVGIGEPPLRIEIPKKLDAVDFQYAFQRVVKTVVEGVQINIISLNDLILLKEAAIKEWDKPRDTEDLNYLLKLKTKNKKIGTVTIKSSQTPLPSLSPTPACTNMPSPSRPWSWPQAKSPYRHLSIHTSF